MIFFVPSLVGVLVAVATGIGYASSAGGVENSTLPLTSLLVGEKESRERKSFLSVQSLYQIQDLASAS